MIAPGRKIIRRVAAEVREFRRWQPLNGAQDVRMYYGYDRLPARTDFAAGGLIKCLDLADVWPNRPEAPNVLYLVSSALPARRELLTRAAQRAGGKVVLNQNGVAYPAWAGSSWRQQNKPNARVYAAADYVVYQSRFCRECAERFLGPRKGPGRILYNPVNTNVFTPSPKKSDSRAPMLLVAGSHHDAIRVECAIEALAHLRRLCDARLTVAGRMLWSANAAEQAIGWAEANGVRDAVIFAGPYTQQQAPDLLRSADVLLHLKWQDSCPRLVVEAMACGLPVVYSATGGTPELVGDDAGIGVSGNASFEQSQPLDAGQVAQAVLAVISEHNRYTTQARDRAVRMFSVEPWLESHRDLLQALTAEAP